MNAVFTTVHRRQHAALSVTLPAEEDRSVAVYGLGLPKRLSQDASVCARATVSNDDDVNTSSH